MGGWAARVVWGWFCKSLWWRLLSLEVRRRAGRRCEDPGAARTMRTRKTVADLFGGVRPQVLERPMLLWMIMTCRSVVFVSAVTACLQWTGGPSPEPAVRRHHPHGAALHRTGRAAALPAARMGSASGRVSLSPKAAAQRTSRAAALQAREGTALHPKCCPCGHGR